MEPNTHTIGLVSDTHGLLRQSITDALKGVDRILHAGDVDFSGILEKLRRVAPVHAVSGNMDKHSSLRHLPRFDIIKIGTIRIGLIHDRDRLDLDPAAAGINVVVHGHTHQPSIEKKDGVLFINPGSAGPRRFKKPISIGILYVAGDAVNPEIIEFNE